VTFFPLTNLVDVEVFLTFPAGAELPQKSSSNPNPPRSRVIPNGDAKTD